MIDKLSALLTELGLPDDTIGHHTLVRDFTCSILNDMTSDEVKVSKTALITMASAFETSAIMIYEAVEGQQYAIDSFKRTVDLLQRLLDQENKAKVN